MVALVIGVVAASAGGLVLASAEGMLTDLPGLLLLVPGAIALRGNVFGAVIGVASVAAGFGPTIRGAVGTACSGLG